MKLAEIMPLTPVQEGILYASTLDPSAPDPYVVQADLALTGPLDPDRLRRSAQAVFDRHPNLRVGFRRRKTGMPVALVLDGAEIGWSVHQLSDLDPAAAQSRWAQLCDEARDHRFDLQTPPLLRLALGRLPNAADGREQWRLLLTNHHLILDGWSAPRVVREIFAAYADDGRVTGLPPVRAFGDYLTWLASRDQAAALERWSAVLGEHCEPCLLAGPQPAALGSRPRQLIRDDLGGLGEALAGRARELGLTLGALIQAAWGLTLGLETGRTDVLYGATVSGRSPEFAGAEDLVGMTLGAVPVRVHATGAQTLADIAEQVQREQASVLSDHWVPLPEIAAAAGTGELFDTLLVVENHPSSSPELLETVARGGLTLTEIAPRDSTHYPLTVQAVVAPRLQLRLHHLPDAVPADRLARITDTLVAVLTAFAEAPETQVAALRAPTGESPVTPSPVDGPALGELLDLRTRPADAPVFECAGDVLTAAELTGRVDALAAQLRRERIGPDSVVAVALPRGLDTAVAVLAILRAGAAVLPIDLEYPREAIDYLLTDAAPAAIITVPGVDLPACAAPLVRPDGHAPAPTGTAPAELPAEPAGDLLAYLVYTSGSTGRPKPVAGTRAGLAARLAWATRDWSAAPGDVRLLKSSLAFIDGLTELLGAVAAGARGVLATDAERIDPAAQARLLAAHGIAQVTAVPSLAATLAATAPEGCAPVTRWVLSGEPLSAEVVRAVSAASPKARVINSYGSSEVAGDVTAADVTDETAGTPVADTPVTDTPVAGTTGTGTPVSIGDPVPGSGVLLLDGLLRPVPPGTIGEFYISGPQLARGYRGRPALTAERFVANPFGPGRLYRTGDLGRRRPGSNRFEFCGRADGQVKIRGHRVETVGVEAALREVDGVTGAAVVARDDGAGSATLWAYVTVAADSSLDDGQGIAAVLATRLPSYQVPAVVVLDALPTLPNGKVNRRALPAPAELTRPGTGRLSTATEHAVAALFAELLRLDADRVGPEDDFFARGGHSLLATRLVHRLTAEHAPGLSIRTVFEQPTVRALAAEVDRLAGAPAPDTALPLPDRRPDPLPATSAQRGVWAAEQLLDPGAGPVEAAYNLPFAVALHGPVDEAALAAAVRRLVARHEALRTRLRADADGGLWAEIADPATPVEVLVHRDEAALTARREQPFDLATELPIRADLVRRDADTVVLSLTVHHGAADEWCAPVIFGELADEYQRILAGASPGSADSPTPAPLQYADAAAAQETLCDRAAERDFWAQTLAGAPDELALPFDRPRPDRPTGRGGTVEFTVTPALAAALRATAERTRLTGFMLAHAATVAVWARLSGTGDIVLGTPVANRRHPALAGVIGMFTNTLPLRIEVGDDPTVEDLLARVRRHDLAALDHQGLPFGEIVDAAGAARRADRPPLVSTLLQYRTAASAPDFPGAQTQIVSPAPRGAKFDLTVEFLDDEDGLTGRLEFARDLFDAATAERIADLLVRALTALTGDPRARLHSLPLTTDTDRAVLARAADTGHTVPDTDLVGLIAQAATAHPEQTAVLAGDDALSYAELSAAAEALAATLVAAGVGVDDVVAVDLPRSAALSVAVLAAQRAGAAYLPLDRDHPAARRAFLLDDARPAALITDDPAAADALPTVLVDRLGAVLSAPPAAGSGPLPDPAALPEPARLHHARAAYLIYTSGSTGNPKAVVVEHRAIVNRLVWMQDRYGLVPGERVLHKTPTGFDVSVWELFWPLIVGATVVMAEPGAHRDPAAIAATLRRHEVTTVHFVPSLLRAFLAEETAADLPRLRRILCSGEALTAPLRDGVRDRLPGVRLHNLYGPTEAAVDVTEADVTDLTGPGVPIGAPVWNTRAHVLDARLRERPIGCWGDLYLSGVQLARGYAGRPDLTATAFVASPFAGDEGGAAGARMYRTGDIARWTAEGVLEFAGRSDGQLKLRGQRVEPGEIEQALLAAGTLAQAVVIGHRTADERTVLAAYAVPAPGSPAEPGEILAAVAELLPAHLVPPTLTLLDALPVTANGKLDRAGLPDPVAPAAAGGATGGPRERAVAEVFGEVLHLPDGAAAGGDDDFFALGGDSIVAITVVNRLRRRGLEVDVKEIFELRTAAALGRAARAVEPAAGQPGGRTDAAADEDSDRPLPLTPIMAQLAARPGRWQSLAQSMTLTLPPESSTEQVLAALDAVIARHQALRLRVEDSAGVWSVRPQPAAATAAADRVSVHEFTAEPERSDFEAITAQVHARLDPAADDPAAGGCLQAALVRGGERAWLLLVIHHLAVDAVSWRILLDDLAAAAAAPGRALPAPGTSLRTYADAVARRAAAPETLTEATAWRAVLGRAAPVHPAVDLGRQRDLVVTRVRLDAAQTQDYLAAGPVTAAFVADVGAAVAEALEATEPFLIDVEGHGRDQVDADLSETVGWLTALWPVLYEPGAPDAAGTVAGRLAQPGYGYGLARYANPRTARLLARSPRAQLLVNYLGAMDLRGDRPWQPAAQARWTRTTPDGDLGVDHLLTVDGRVERDGDTGAGELVAELTWSSAVLTADRAQQLADRLHAALLRRGAQDHRAGA